MGGISDILSAVRRGRLATKDIDELMRYNTHSIASRAQDATFMFSCLAVNTIPADLSATIIKNLDRVYAAFVQTAISVDPLIDISIDRGPLDYMKRMHQNLKLESVINEEGLKSVNEASESKAFLESVIGGDLTVSEEMVDPSIPGRYDGEYRLFIDPTGEWGVAFSESVISSLTMTEKNMLDDYLSEFDLTRFPAYEKRVDPAVPSKSEILSGIINQAGQSSNTDLQMDIIKNSLAPKMVDRDVKRINELQPYGLQVRLMAVNDKKEFVQFIDFIVGIKTVLHPVKSQDIVENIAYVLQNKNAVFNFVRWTTGEISLFKDLIAHIGEAKYDASYRSRGASPFIPNLKRLKNQKVAVGLFGARKLVPNATIVITSFEVDDLKTRYGLDIHNVSLAKKVIQELFLMTLMIVDEGSGTVEIMYQSSSAFETYAMETLDRETSLSSNKLGKEIGRMISQ